MCPCGVASVFVSRTDHLALNNQLVWSNVEPTSPAHSFPHLLVALCVGLRLCGLFPHTVCDVQIWNLCVTTTLLLLNYWQDS